MPSKVVTCPSCHRKHNQAYCPNCTHPNASWEEPDESRRKLLHSSLDTRSFTFDVYVEAEPDRQREAEERAEQLLAAAWLLHCKQYTAATVSWPELRDSVRHQHVETNAAYRDGDFLIAGEWPIKVGKGRAGR